MERDWGPNCHCEEADITVVTDWQEMYSVKLRGDDNSARELGGEFGLSSSSTDHSTRRFIEILQ